MPNLIFVTILFVLLGGLYFWGFRNLSGERWQFFGVIPMFKNSNGQWDGLNMTYYGIFNANALTLSVAIVYIILAAMGLSLWTISLILAIILVPCVPGAKLIARWVEKKPHTISIGGASFVGLIAAPWLLLLINQLLEYWNCANIPVMPSLATVSIAYVLGEGCGRLACLSFGCCYGKPMSDLPPVLRRLLYPFSITYQGHTKKIAYASEFQDRKVVAIAPITAVLYTLTAISGLLFLLHGFSHIAYLLCVLIAQIWRFLSEFLRADFRGAGSISTYQKMALFAAFYAVCIFVWMPAVSMPVDIYQGLRIVWNPSIILACQVLWIGIFLYTGRSQVTGSRISFHVRKDRI